MNQNKEIFTLISPCLNEEDALPTLIEKLTPVLDQCTGGLWKIIIIDDGSTDRTVEVLRSINEKDGRVCGISLSRNFGHQPAIAAGLSFVDSEYVGIMDADLQDPVETLVDLYHKVSKEGYDVALGVRGKREAPFLLRVGYKFFYRLMKKFADNEWPLDAGDFSVFNRKALKAIQALPERDRMLRGLRSWVGFKQTTITYARPARTQGTTKYNFFKLLNLAITAFVGYTSLPLRLASFIGIAMSFFSFFLTLLFLVNRLFPAFTIFGYNIGENPGTATLAVLISFVSGMLFFCLGIIGEYVALLVREIKRRPTAIVSSAIGDLNVKPTSSNILSLA